MFLFDSKKKKFAWSWKKNQYLRIQKESRAVFFILIAQIYKVTPFHNTHSAKRKWESVFRWNIPEVSHWWHQIGKVCRFQNIGIAAPFQLLLWNAIPTGIFQRQEKVQSAVKVNGILIAFCIPKSQKKKSIA